MTTRGNNEYINISYTIKLKNKKWSQTRMTPYQKVVQTIALGTCRRILRVGKKLGLSLGQLCVRSLQFFFSSLGTEKQHFRCSVFKMNRMLCIYLRFHVSNKLIFDIRAYSYWNKWSNQRNGIEWIEYCFKKSL